MALSPRNELRIAAVTEFERRDGKWFWHTGTPQADTADEDGQLYDTLDEAITAFFAHRGVDLSEPVDPTEAHYSEPVKITDDEYHIREYAYGAPNPIQAVL